MHEIKFSSFQQFVDVRKRNVSKQCVKYELIMKEKNNENEKHETLAVRISRELSY